MDKPDSLTSANAQLDQFKRPGKDKVTRIAHLDKEQEEVITNVKILGKEDNPKYFAWYTTKRKSLLDKNANSVKMQPKEAEVFNN